MLSPKPWNIFFHDYSRQYNFKLVTLCHFRYSLYVITMLSLTNLTDFGCVWVGSFSLLCSDKRRWFRFQSKFHLIRITAILLGNINQIFLFLIDSWSWGGLSILMVLKAGFAIRELHVVWFVVSCKTTHFYFFLLSYQYGTNIRFFTIQTSNSKVRVCSALRMPSLPARLVIIKCKDLGRW